MGLLLAGVVTITGCQGRRQAPPAAQLGEVQSPRPNAAEQEPAWWHGSLEQLKKQAASDLGCATIEVVEIGKWVAEAKGCEKELVYAYDEREKEWVSPWKRASYELSCPNDELVAHSLGGGSVGVSGCGNKVVYVVLRGHEDGRVQWIINSDSMPSNSKSASEPKATGGVAGTK